MTREPIPVVVLHTPGCGRWEAARDAVPRVAEEEGVAVALSERVVESVEQARARAQRLPGSPTV